MAEDLRTRVEHWLQALGCTPVDQDDPMTRWHLDFEYPVGSGHRMLVAGLRGEAEAIVIASVVSISPGHLEGFESLIPEDKRAFLFGFRRTLNFLELEFQLSGMTGPLTCPTSFQVSARRFEDGLSLDEFARSVGAVYKAELEGIWYIQEWLGAFQGPVAHFEMDADDLPQA